MGCRMTLFSVALHQHRFNLFISVAFQDKLSYSWESAIVPVSQTGSGTAESSKDLGANHQLWRFDHSPFVPAQSLPSSEVQSSRDLYYSPDLKQHLLVFPASAFYLQEMSNHFFSVTSAALGGRGIFVWVNALCKGAPKRVCNGCTVALWIWWLHAYN